jgi:hypothetical protein
VTRLPDPSTNPRRLQSHAPSVDLSYSSHTYASATTRDSLSMMADAIDDDQPRAVMYWDRVLPVRFLDNYTDMTVEQKVASLR